MPVHCPKSPILMVPSISDYLFCEILIYEDAQFKDQTDGNFDELNIFCIVSELEKTKENASKINKTNKMI